MNESWDRVEWRPAKRIVVCCDGTWNAPRLNHPEKNRPTNVIKVVRAIEPQAVDGRVQVVEYVRGVGTRGRVDRWLGGATGWGISNNIQQAYEFIAHNYRKGDEIYLFGFSRGAYTVRSLAGFIGQAGILKKEAMHLLPAAYRYYRTPPAKRKTDPRFENSFAESREAQDVDIHFIGVWDTVGALGAPTPLLNRLTRKHVGFHDTKLGSNVKYAYQALALHEMRKHFRPAIWTDKSPDTVVEQVWFAGSHSDIGGGYGVHGLSDIPLRWMVDRAAATGLDFNQEFLHDIADPNTGEPVKKSRKFPYSLLRPFVRPIGPESLDKFKYASVAEFQDISVQQRLTEVPPSKLGYDLEKSFRQVDERSQSLEIAEGIEPRRPHSEPLPHVAEAATSDPFESDDAVTKEI